MKLEFLITAALIGTLGMCAPQTSITQDRALHHRMPRTTQENFLTSWKALYGTRTPTHEEITSMAVASFPYFLEGPEVAYSLVLNSESQTDTNGGRTLTILYSGKVWDFHVNLQENTTELLCLNNH